MDTTTKLFFGVMGNPYETELTTSLLRLVAEAVNEGHHVAVWTCGGATTITRSALGQIKPKNVLDLLAGCSDRTYPSTAALVRSLVQQSNGRLQWYVCRHCAEERGALDQIAEARIQAPMRFAQHLEAATVPVIMGVK